MKRSTKSISPLSGIKKKEDSIKSEIKGDVINNVMEVKRITKKYYEQLYTKKLDNQQEMDKFLGTCNLQRLNHEAIKKYEQTYN